MKRRTKALQYADIADAVKCINEGKKVKRSTYKDGSIPTKSVVPVRCPYPEKDVVHDCLVWLHRHHIMCNRHDAASFQNDRGQWGVYGIKGAGDIIGIVGDYGTHFEIECKAGKGGRLSPGQQKRKHDVTYAGGIYLIIHGVEELEYHYFGDFV
ncbi:hypothetical protein LCGC14_0422970 [marine sediment metagenome]|uniref:VRR-NUC domain-containing protein n=1 Tax=marine sediment metagenome TaxID=412755 RepID=A0A0F9SWH1_9ZZZZ